jgi:hypothetical protein
METTKKLHWCNVITSTGKYKLAVGELINKELGLFDLRTCSSEIANEPGWAKIQGRKGWYHKEFLKEEINQFFDYN